MLTSEHSGQMEKNLGRKGRKCIMSSENVDLPRRRAAGAWEGRYFLRWGMQIMIFWRSRMSILMSRRGWKDLERKDYSCLWKDEMKRDYFIVWKDLMKRDYFIVTERTWWKEIILLWLKGLGEKRPFVVVERTWWKGTICCRWKDLGERLLLALKALCGKRPFVVMGWLWKTGWSGTKAQLIFPFIRLWYSLLYQLHHSI